SSTCPASTPTAPTGWLRTRAGRASAARPSCARSARATRTSSARRGGTTPSTATRWDGACTGGWCTTMRCARSTPARWLSGRTSATCSARPEPAHSCSGSSSPRRAVRGTGSTATSSTGYRASERTSCALTRISTTPTTPPDSSPGAGPSGRPSSASPSASCRGKAAPPQRRREPAARGRHDEDSGQASVSVAERRPKPANVATADGLAVRLTGYMGHTLGLGAAARGYVAGLAAAGVPVSTITVPLHHLELPVALEDAYGEHGFEDLVHGGRHGFEIVAVNADELPDFAERLGEDYFEGPRIGIWGWETNSIPARWQRAFGLVDEIWVYSRFMAENIGAEAPVPVLALPPPVEQPL